jgi:hypothetical protein
MGSIIFSDLNNAFYNYVSFAWSKIIVKSYSNNNNNHLIILPKTYDLLTK